MKGRTRSAHRGIGAFIHSFDIWTMTISWFPQFGRLSVFILQDLAASHVLKVLQRDYAPDGGPLKFDKAVTFMTFTTARVVKQELYHWRSITVTNAVQVRWTSSEVGFPRHSYALITKAAILMY